MEVRAGYKQTEVGVIPSEWEVVSVQKLVDENILEKPLDGNHGNIHPKSSDYVDHGIPFVMANNFLNGQVDLLGCKFITKQRADKLQKGFSISRDVLLTHKGTVGETAVVGELSTDYIMLTPQVTYYRVRDENRLNNQFLRQYFDSQPFQSLFISLAGGGTRAYLGIVKQLALPVIEPPIEEQRAIAAALSGVDALLGGLERLIAKKRDLKQAAMQQLLTGQTRLPGFSGEWEVVEFGDIATIRNAKVISSSTQAGTQCVELESIGQGSGRLLGSVDATGSSSKYSFKKGDVLFGRLRAYLRKYWLAQIDGVCSTEIWPLIPRDDRLIAGYLHLLVQTNDFVDAAGVSYGTHMPRSDWSVLGKFAVQLPLLPEQIAIAAVLSDMDAELVALEQRRTKTRALKQAMMQELLTGRIRLIARGDAENAE